VWYVNYIPIKLLSEQQVAYHIQHCTADPSQHSTTMKGGREGEREETKGRKATIQDIVVKEWKK
jgi:hypothetical protein